MILNEVTIDKDFREVISYWNIIPCQNYVFEHFVLLHFTILLINVKIKI